MYTIANPQQSWQHTSYKINNHCVLGKLIVSVKVRSFSNTTPYIRNEILSLDVYINIRVYINF